MERGEHARRPFTSRISDRLRVGKRLSGSGLRGWPRCGFPFEPRTNLGRPPDALGSADAGRGRPRASSTSRFWLDYFRRTHSDGVCLERGRLRGLLPHGGPASITAAGGWATATRSATWSRAAASSAWPSWRGPTRTPPTTTSARRTPTGSPSTTGRNPRRHWASPEMWVTCALGPYNFEFMTAVHREIMARYRVDGIFINRWSGSGMCFCEHCRTQLPRPRPGHDLPRTNDPAGPGPAGLHPLAADSASSSSGGCWDAEVRTINPDSCVIPNTGGGATSPLDMKTIGELAPILFADRQARSGLMPPWANGKNAKEYRATMGRKPIGGIFSVGVEEAYRWKDSVQSEAEIRIWVADGIANGLRPWFTKFAGTLHDRRWLRVVEDLYRWHHRVENYLRNEAPLARVGLVYSQQTAWFHGGPRAREKVEDHALGWYQALVEARIPFEMVHDRLLDAEHLRRVQDADPAEHRRALGRAMPAAPRVRRARRRAWWRRTRRRCTTSGANRRQDFGLADLFGVSFRGTARGPMRNSYLRLEGDPRTGRRHPLLAGLDDASRIIHGTWRLDVTPRRAFPDPPLTLIPSYPDLPMEKVYPAGRQDRHRRGLPARGRRRPGRLLSLGHRPRLLGGPLRRSRTLARAMPSGGRPTRSRPCEVKGPGVLDVTVWRQQRSMTVHLVNLTNPMMMKGPFRELIPVGEQQVVVRLPNGDKAHRIQLLRDPRDLAVQQDGRNVTLNVPSIRDIEIIAIDLDS